MTVVASKIESVAVVGAGFMGTGIAETVAVAGLPVIVRDVDGASLDRARAARTSLARARCRAASSTLLTPMSREGGSS